MKIGDIFYIRNRGLVAAVKIEGRVPEIGDVFQVRGQHLTVTGIERHLFLRDLRPGDNIGLLLVEMRVGDELKLVRVADTDPLPPPMDTPIPDTEPQTPTSKSSQKLRAVDAPIIDF